MRLVTSKMKQTYDFIRRYIIRNSIAPTEREIAEGIGIISRGVAHKYVHQLADAGLLTVTGDAKRNIKLRRKSDRITSALPVLNVLGDESLNLAPMLDSACFAIKRGDEYIICTSAAVRKGSYLVVFTLDDCIYIDTLNNAAIAGFDKLWGGYKCTMNFNITENVGLIL